MKDVIDALKDAALAEVDQLTRTAGLRVCDDLALMVDGISILREHGKDTADIANGLKSLALAIDAMILRAEGKTEAPVVEKPATIPATRDDGADFLPGCPCDNCEAHRAKYAAKDQANS